MIHMTVFTRARDALEFFLLLVQGSGGGEAGAGGRGHGFQIQNINAHETAGVITHHVIRDPMPGFTPFGLVRARSCNGVADN